MILSASRRTDIPSHYARWMVNRLREGEVLIPYPRDPDRLGRLRLTPELVDCIVFWSKNPAPMLEHLPNIDALGYRYYFTFTLTGYGAEVERNLPPKEQVADTFLRLSDRLGPERVDWRYDPILVDARHPVSWHLDRFGALCRRLRGATGRCIINFVKAYPHLPHIRELEDALIRQVAQGMAGIAAEFGIPLTSCADAQDLRDLGIAHGACIDADKVAAICGAPILAKKDPGQPAACRCVQSIDIGMYDSCSNGCSYCYAITDEARMRARMAAHDPDSALLIGRPGAQRITDRTAPSLKDPQLRLF